jgi:pimeloyl-ACP methyl ester carboxylesterase
MIRRSYINTPEGEVHVRMAGDPSASPLVLLHQTASSSEMFERLMAELEGEFWLIAPDTPGFGQSFRPRERATIPLYARALLAALDGLGVARCHLFGHHTGATVAVEMASARPALVSRLALGGPCLLTEREARELAERTPWPELHEDGSHLLAVWRRIAAKEPDAPLELRQREAQLTLLAGPRWVEGYHAVFGHAAAFEQKLRALAVPTLVFAGDRDTVYHLLEPAYEALKQGQKAVLAGHGTYVCDRAPGEVAALLRAFFA